MINETLEILNQFNWQTIVAMMAIGWYFTREIRESLTKLEEDVRQQGKRTDKLYEMFIDLLKQNKTNNK